MVLWKIQKNLLVRTCKGGLFVKAAGLGKTNKTPKNLCIIQSQFHPYCFISYEMKIIKQWIRVSILYRDFYRSLCTRNVVEISVN